MEVKLSKKNSKMGKILNLSLTPITSCRPDAPCAKECYAMKSYRMYKETRAAWDWNYNFWNEDPLAFTLALSRQLSELKPKFFRWHVGGDIPCDLYLEMMCHIAYVLPDTKFLAFTKQYEIVNMFIHEGYQIPKNLKIIFSAWPGLKLDNPHYLPVAWMQDGSEDRYEEQEILECHGQCDACGMCWNLDNIGKDVVFFKH